MGSYQNRGAEDDDGFDSEDLDDEIIDEMKEFSAAA